MRRQLLGAIALCLVASLQVVGKASGLDEDLFMKHLSTLVSSIDVKNSGNLYHAQQALMFPVKGAFELGLERHQKVIVDGLSLALDRTETLSTLRERAKNGRIVIEPRLLDSDQSGSGERRIFPLEESIRGMLYKLGVNSTQKMIREIPLVQWQFCYLISFTMKKAAVSAGEDRSRILFQRFVDNSFSFLLKNVVFPYWLEIEARSWAARHQNMRERFNALIYPIRDPALERKSFFKAITDADLFFLAIAADLNYVLHRHRSLLSSDRIVQANLELLKEVTEVTVKIVQQRLQPEGFLFQMGVWSDHPDFLYAGYLSEEFPSIPRPDPNIAEDSAHSHRWPWWLESFRDSWPADHEHYQFYQNILMRLASHFIEKVTVFPDDRRILLTNYMNGANGWYRVGYKGRPWGYGPFTLSESALTFSWTILAKYDDRIRKYNRILCSMINSADPEIIAFRVKFFGDRTSSNSYQNGWRDKDRLGEHSIYACYCQISESLGLQ